LVKVRNFFLALVMLSVLGATLSGAYFWQWLHAPLGIENDIDFDIQPGDTLVSVSAQLHANGVIDFPGIWRLYATLHASTHILAGEFTIAAGSSPVDILDLFQSGKVKQYQFTVVEGTTISDALASLRQEPKLEKVLPAEFDPALTKWEFIDKPHLEGWFFPDTYNYVAGDSDMSILMRAHKTMTSVLAEEWQNRAENLPYKNAHEALIMASIIEKETAAPHERAEIAGVFVRRLQNDMRLQTDPTVIYGMGSRYKGNITRADLKQATPYNTYVIKGLPPTPIALVGREAIYAALHPAEGDALYFVAKGDGTHHFSKTLQEHQAAVKKYQLNRRKNYRSSYQK
jgi:UPF0755 protein